MVGTPASPSYSDVTDPRYSVVGVCIHAVNPEQALARIEQWIAAGERRYVCHANVHGVIEAWRDPALRRIYNRAGLTVADGMPLVWVGQWRGHRSVRRVYGPDLMLALAARATAAGHRCYLYGGAPGVGDALAATLGLRFPGLRVVGTDAPPFRPLTAEEDEAAVQRINAARPDIVWVGLGCPRQERWMSAHRNRLDAAVLVGVGAAFDFHAGRVPQAPRWLMRLGLEWLFRLFQEPRRLWRRYLLYNPLFVALLALELSGLSRPGVSDPPDPQD
jgi:N-acetylglucosaminyldiphosphoundecaprenol N-acetyl-beta-D-mannosaminyltransferase